MGLRIGVGVFLCLTVAFAQKSKKKAKESGASARDSLSWRAAASPYVKGVVYFSQGLIEEALPYFLGALEKAPHSAGIHYYLAQIAYAQRDYPRMLTHAEKAYQEAPNELWLALGYATALALNEEHQTAITFLEKLLQKYPHHPEILLRLAQSYRRIGRLSEADRYYEQLQQRSGILYEDIFQERVQMFVEAKELGRAIALTESLIVRWPRTEVYRETAIRLYELAQDLLRLTSHVQALLSLDAANALAWETVLNHIEWFENQWEEAVWDSLLAKPEVPVEIRYQLLRHFSDEGAEVRARVDQLLQQAPNAEGWALRAELWLEDDELDSAAIALREAIRLDSTRWEWWERWIYLLYRKGGGDSLARAISQVSERFPQQGLLYLWQGIVATQRRQANEALSAFRRGWSLLHTIDTSIARIALFYEGVAYLLAKTPWPAAYETRLSTYYKAAEIALLRYLLYRYAGLTPPAQTAADAEKALAQLPPTHPLRLWAEGLLSPTHLDWQKRLSDNLAALPLEGWMTLLPLGPQTLGPTTYAQWKTWAVQTYPLCATWQSLP